MTKWIIVVDDDTANLQMAGHILSKNNMRVTALKSGKLLLDYIRDKGIPDLILLDIKMPEMDGFETLKLLRAMEREKGLGETPVIFLTADEDTNTESRGFEMGVSDYIRKPFNPEVLLRRIDNIVSKQKEMISLKNEANTDKLTGFLNKAATGTVLSSVCTSVNGCLMMIDLDSFKLVNDIYGHEMGDKVLISFANIIKDIVPEGSKCGRIGGDEFVSFAAGVDTEEQVAEITKLLNEKLTASAKELMGPDMSIPLGASVGAVFVPRHGNDYNSLLKFADKSLYSVKKNGKHGYSLFSAESFTEDEMNVTELDIQSLSEILGERNIPNVALQLDSDAFSHVYRYVIRYIMRHHLGACKILFTLNKSDAVSDKEFKDGCDEFGNHVRKSLRKSDILMRNRYNQYFVLLTDIREESIKKVLSHIIDKWHEAYKGNLVITYETEFIGQESESHLMKKDKKVIIVDDDSINLQVAGKVLSSGGIHVIALKSGQALLDYFDNPDARADLILLDIKMSGLDGFETLSQLRQREGEAGRIPVIFLTADESSEAESRGLAMGAMDFIKKPFVPEILMLRVSHLLELITLQKQLSSEVEEKTRENKNLFLHLVESLAVAIDTKDNYTNGHSQRVAEYSKEIAKRAGLPEKEQEEIYIMGLLHDIGKIGVPDAVINKPDTLSNDEYEMVKKHPVMGAHILENIKEDPNLALGAKFHHERYDGKGYPEGLAGDEIAESAKIIAVADAYDAMSSFRSYRGVLSQDTVYEEIEKGRGTQFDPKYADIMLDIIKEDKDYTLREKQDEKQERLQ
ncbi:MAG: response regulator [Lachnospiraceae bacterium]|nr:response regulator [Lachnospiraceae bacterium]